MRVLLCQVSDIYREDVIEVKDWDELMERLHKEHDSWIIEKPLDYMKRKYNVEWVAIKLDGKMEDIL